MTAHETDYHRERERFRGTAQRHGAELSEYRHPHAVAPDGGALYTDVAWLGPRDAAKVLLCVSGTHGVEGHCGSACQAEFLAEPPAPGTEGIARVFVHALNPYGMAHDRRVNEDNIDINRNWVDHAAHPHNADYELVHEALLPAAWDGPQREAADARLLQLAGEHGVTFVQAAITGGQWAHPDGLFYGGTGRCWSAELLAGLCAELLAGREHVGYIDLHTGLGPWGNAEPIFRGGDDPGAFERARSWFGPVTRSEDGTASSTIIVGNTATIVLDSLTAEQRLTAITLEFGTLNGLEVLTALRADNWLRLQAEPDPELRARIITGIREAFWPSDPAWRETVLAHGRTAYARALAGLAGL